MGATTWFHGGQNPSAYEGLVHLGTRDAAQYRLVVHPEGSLHRVALREPNCPVGSLDAPVDDGVANYLGMFLDEWRRTGDRPEVEDFDEVWDDYYGYATDYGVSLDTDAIFYENAEEHRGSVSVMASPGLFASVVPASEEGAGQ